MSTITIKGYIVGQHFSFMSEVDGVHWSFRVGGPPPGLDSETIFVFPHAFDFEVPDDINIVAAQLAGIEREKEAARAGFTKRMRELNAQASKLMALEMAA